MGLIDVLRKLGILRFGAEKAVYRNAKERPLSLQQDGILNSEKDTVNFGKGRESPGGDAGSGTVR